MTSAPEPDRFPCAQCGASLRFSPGAQTLKCPYCGHENPIETPRAGPWGAAGGDAGEIKELDYAAALREQGDNAEMEETRTVHCDSCGAEVEFDAAEHAAQCPFCDSPLVADTGVNRHFKPKGILPFAVTQDEAHNALESWMGGLWFAPSGLRDYARAGRRMQGIYAPYWTFDAETASNYVGARGDVYYVTEYVSVIQNGKRVNAPRQVAKVRWTPASGRVQRFFDDVLVLASHALPEKYAKRLGPWDLHALMPYNTGYLAGFRSEAYTISLEEGFAEARAMMDLQIRRDVRFDIGGDRQQIHDIDTQISDIAFKHILLPVWLAAYKYRGRTFHFIVNGRTAQVQGERPYSRWKIAIAVVAGAIVAALIGAALYARQG